MINILNKYKEHLQKELAIQCVNDTESILHDLDWWGGLDLPEGYAFDFNVYEVSDTDVNSSLKAVAYFCDQRDDQGIPSSSYSHSIDLEVPQFLIDQYHLRKASREDKRQSIVAWSVAVEWSDGTKQELMDVPSHISQDIDEWLIQVEDEENE